MKWYDRLSVALSPGIFAGTMLSDWFRLLWRVRFRVSPTALPRIISATIASAVSTACKPVEDRHFAEKISQTEVQPPIFVLGYWRSGTTHLFNLLSQDDRFCCPNFYQVLFAHTFLFSEKTLVPVLRPLIPSTRGFDNVKMGIDIAQEEEFGLSTLTTNSVYMSVAFPGAEDFYDRFLTFRDASREEITAWKSAFLHLAKKLTVRYGRPIIFKSPPHTGRIKLILDVFPDAKFVHIHRNPYTVFQSNRKLFTGWHNLYAMQRRDFSKLDDRILRQYTEVHDAFFEQRKLIPPGCFHEISYEELERDPIGQIREVYERLQLPSFDYAEPKIVEYSKTLEDYKKNRHTDLDSTLKSRIATEWKRSFDEWGYSAN